LPFSSLPSHPFNHTNNNSPPKKKREACLQPTNQSSPEKGIFERQLPIQIQKGRIAGSGAGAN
jgi:hypothetical protein